MIEIDQERSIPELELRFAQSRSSGPGRSSGRHADGYLGKLAAQFELRLPPVFRYLTRSVALARRRVPTC